MSFTDQLRAARSRPVVPFHKFRTNYVPRSDRVYAFVEGYADEAFYRAHIQKHIPNDRDIYTYNCGGKAGVAAAFADVTKGYPQCERVLFFLDKDVDDITGKHWPMNPRIFITECYSIENYVVTKHALARYFKDYVKIGKVEIDIEKALEKFEEELAHFHAMMLPMMAWIVLMRRAGYNVVLQDINLAALFRITDDGNCRQARRRSIQYLLKMTQVNGSSPDWKRIKATCSELRRLPPKTYIRGKFEGWWFIEYGRRMIDGLEKIVAEGGGSMKIQMPLNAGTFIQLLAAGIATPATLNSFLEFHTNRDVSRTLDINAGGAGMLSKIRQFFKG
jgi:hypothetical protein